MKSNTGDSTRELARGHAWFENIDCRIVYRRAYWWEFADKAQLIPGTLPSRPR